MSGALGPLGARRHRITLLSVAEVIGAGGRMQRTNPVIADVWAEISLSADISQQADRSARKETATFTTAYREPYCNAAQIEWRGKRYGISAVSLVGVDARQIIFTAATDVPGV